MLQKVCSDDELAVRESVKIALTVDEADPVCILKWSSSYYKAAGKIDDNINYVRIYTSKVCFTMIIANAIESETWMCLMNAHYEWGGD